MNPYISAMNKCQTKIKSVTFQRVEVLEFETLSFPAASPASPQQRTSYGIDTFERSIRRTKIQELDEYSTIAEYLQQIPKYPNRISRRRPTRQQESGRSSINSSSSSLLREEQKEQRRKLSPAMPQRQRSLVTE